MDELAALNLTGTNQSPNLALAKTKEAAKTVADEFEAMFIAQMLAPMFEALDTDGITGGGSAERAFRPMLVNEYAKEMSQQGGIGIADQVYTEILRMQGLDPASDS